MKSNTARRERERRIGVIAAFVIRSKARTKGMKGRRRRSVFAFYGEQCTFIDGGEGDIEGPI